MDKENLYTDTHTTVEYYSTIKKNEILPFAATSVVLGWYYAKWNKSEKDKYCMISLNCGI